jgi:hypothetical protein
MRITQFWHPARYSVLRYTERELGSCFLQLWMIQLSWSVRLSVYNWVKVTAILFSVQSTVRKMRRRRSSVENNSNCKRHLKLFCCCFWNKTVANCAPDMFSSLKFSNLRARSKNSSNSGCTPSHQDVAASTVLTSKPPRTPVSPNRRSSKCKYHSLSEWCTALRFQCQSL